MTRESKTKIVAVVGPTASGKTNLAIEIAKKFNGEIISADSRQVYKGLDIGTGKVTEEEKQNVPHHLIDTTSIDTVYTGKNFMADATTSIADISNRGCLPIIAGGTSFYLDLLRGKQSVAEVEPNESLRTELNKKSTEELFEELQYRDPARSETIDKQNKRRLIRAIEIIETLGKVPATKEEESPYEFLVIGLETEKEALREKFKERLEEWMKRGFEEEVEALMKNPIFQIRLTEFGFEYQLMSAYLQKEFDYLTLVQRFIEKNWQYAKRQITWLKRDNEIIWFALKDKASIFHHVETFLKK